MQRENGESRIFALWAARPPECRCVVDVMLLEQWIMKNEPALLEGQNEDPYKYLMKLLWDQIIDKADNGN